MKIFKKVLKYFAIFMFGIVGYLVVVTSLSYISVNDELEKKYDKIPIYILTNGVHTDIVLPIKNEQYNWSNLLKFQHTKSKDSTSKFVALGWGDKGFYLETPTWADLKTSTALKAASGLSSSAMHVTFYKNLNLSFKKENLTTET